MKQLVQTRPAIVFLVGQASWNMFRQSFGHLIHSTAPLPVFPEDGPYTLLRMTTQQECLLKFSTKIGSHDYALSTRLVITPHFSYNVNFMPQFRMSPESFAALEKQYPAAIEFLQSDPRLVFQKPPGSFVVAGIPKHAASVLADLRQKFADAAPDLMLNFYDPHQTLAVILEEMYAKGELAYTSPKDAAPGFLTRGNGPCVFCVNHHWKFPKGCPYGKPDEKRYPIGFLEKVTEAMIQSSGATTVTLTLD